MFCKYSYMGISITMNILKIKRTSLSVICFIVALTGCSNQVTTSSLTASDILKTNTQQSVSLPLGPSQALSKNSRLINIQLKPIAVDGNRIISISADSSYYAASGRACRNATLKTTSRAKGQYKYIVCQKSPDQWVLINSIHLN